MKKKMLKSLLCLTLAGSMVFGQFLVAMAAEAPEDVEDTSIVDVVDEPAAVEEEPAAVEEEPAAVEEEPAAVEEEPAAVEEEPAAVEEEPVAEEPVAEAADEEEAEAIPQQQIVAFTKMDTVTGLAYDAVAKRIYWNRVPNADEYNVVITDTATNMEVCNADVYDLYYDHANDSFTNAGGSFSVSVTARTYSYYYLLEANVVYDELWTKYPGHYSDFDDYAWANADRTLVNVYKYPAKSDEAKLAFDVGPYDASTTTITTLVGVRLKGIRAESSYENIAIFELINPPRLARGERVQWQYANNAEFEDSSVEKPDNRVNTSRMDDPTGTFALDLNGYAPGETVFVRARVYNQYFVVVAPATDRYGVYTAAVTYAVPQLVMSSISTSVTADSITLQAYIYKGTATGYKFEKQVGKKWVTLNVGNDRYFTDAGLAKNTKYTYRAQAYHYNEKTKVTTWSDVVTVKTTTWGAALNLKAEAASTTAVKLTWNKIADAEGYEVWRSEGSNYGNIRENGEIVNDNSQYTLVKDITKGSTKTYTDKKLEKNKSYSYTVRAYRTINGNKTYVSESASVSLKVSSLQNFVGYYTAKAAYKTTWTKMLGIEGYKVEQKDLHTGLYVQIGTLSKKAASYTAPKVNPGQASVEYRITPYAAGKVFTGVDFIVTSRLATVQNVQAKVTAEGIQVSWNPVAGADYYIVQRTAQSGSTYNKTTKSYEYNYYYSDMVYDAYLDTTGCDPSVWDNYYSYNDATSYRNAQITGTSVVDRRLTYKVRDEDYKGDDIEIGTDAGGKPIYQTKDELYSGPELDVTYYYYVYAVAKSTTGSVENGYTYSEDSKLSAGVAFSATPAPKVSKISSAKSAKAGQVAVKYGKASGAAGYAIYRSTSKNGTYTLAGTTTKTSFTDTGLISGKTYYYKVASYVVGKTGANVYSELTAAKSVKVQ